MISQLVVLLGRFLLDLSKDGSILTDKTYSGSLSENALHYLVADSVVVRNKNDNSIVTDWHFDEAGEIKKIISLFNFNLCLLMLDNM